MNQESTKFYLISLGCAKNLVESENLSNALTQKGFIITDKIRDASLIVINTCGFIKEAKQESINTILSVFTEKKRSAKVVVFGCLVQRYLEDLKISLPEVHLFLPVMPFFEAANKIAEVFPPNVAKQKKSEKNLLFTPNAYTYVKISDGCKNYCSYCAIPLIRGSLKSRHIDEILAEVETKVKKGVKELNLIAQDITAYGTDIYGKPSLEMLVRKILKIKGDYWLRLLYLYPTRVSDELIDIVANEEKVVKYLDIPLQHSENRILKLMNRNYTKAEVTELIEKIRSKIPSIFLRTSLIVGFPTESDEDFLNLVDFVKKIKFEHLGVFEYSLEEDTSSSKLTPKILAKVKQKRKREIMKIQKVIAQEKNRAFIGKIYPCLIESYVDEFGAIWTGRIYTQAPDVDGVTFVANYNPKMGYLTKVKIEDVKGYDLIAKVV